MVDETYASVTASPITFDQINTVLSAANVGTMLSSGRFYAMKAMKKDNIIKEEKVEAIMGNNKNLIND
jgi:hypothetical protein